MSSLKKTYVEFSKKRIVNIIYGPITWQFLLIHVTGLHGLVCSSLIYVWTKIHLKSTYLIRYDLQEKTRKTLRRHDLLKHVVLPWIDIMRFINEYLVCYFVYKLYDFGFGETRAI